MFFFQFVRQFLMNWIKITELQTFPIPILFFFWLVFSLLLILSFFLSCFNFSKWLVIGATTWGVMESSVTEGSTEAHDDWCQLAIQACVSQLLDTAQPLANHFFGSWLILLWTVSLHLYATHINLWWKLWSCKFQPSHRCKLENLKVVIH